MAYRVVWKKLPEKVIIREETYSDRETALTEADLVMAEPSPLEVSVVGDDGVRHYIKVVGNA